MPRPRSLRRSSLASLLALLCLGACAPVAVTTQIGYARLEVAGELALASDGGDPVAQDIRTAFGLGSEQGSPYLRVVADWGVPEFRVAGFWFQESGTGVLTESFGGLPAGTSVATDFELGNAKLALDFAIPVGPLTIAPGVLFDVFAIDFRASSSPGNREEVDEIVGVPMPFLRVEAPLSGLCAAVEFGYFDAPDFVGVEGRFADLEATLAWQAQARLDFVAGYRWFAADAEGETATDSAAVDLQVRGWFVGGGLRF